MTKIIYDDGSAGSRLLQKEQKDAQVIKVSGSDLVQNFTKFDPKNDDRIYLPFSADELSANNEQIRKDIQKVESLGFKNQIVLPFEGDIKKDVEYRAKDTVEKGEGKVQGSVANNEEKPYKTVRTEDRTVQPVS